MTMSSGQQGRPFVPVTRSRHGARHHRRMTVIGPFPQTVWNTVTTEMPSHYCINFIFLNLRAILSDLHATCHVPAISQVSIIFHVHPTHHPIICFHLLSRSAIFLQPLITHFLLRLFTHISAIRPCFIAMINGSSPSFPINARHGPVHVNTLIQHLARVPIIMLSFILTYF